MGETNKEETKRREAEHEACWCDFFTVRAVPWVCCTVLLFQQLGCIELTNNLVLCQKSTDLTSQLTTGSKTRQKIKKETAACGTARDVEYKPFLMFAWVKCGQSFGVFYTRSPTAHGGNEHGKSSSRQATAGRRLGRHSDSKSVCMKGRSWKAFRKRRPVCAPCSCYDTNYFRTLLKY